MSKEESPQFDDFEYEKILQWAGAKVTFADEFVNGRTGEKIKIKKEAYWELFWEHGFIGFDGFRKEDEIKARKAAALFIYLWTRGVDPGVAERCATAYVLSYSISKI